MTKKKNKEKAKENDKLKAEAKAKADGKGKDKSAGKEKSGKGKGGKHGKKKDMIDAILDFSKSAPGKRPGKPYFNTQHLLSESMSLQVEHGKLVSNLAYEVAKQLDLSEQACKEMIIAGFLHDIGKTTLVEPGPEEHMMLVEEMNSLRQHPVRGYDILKKHGFSDTICLAVRYHHENYDGSGYPENLSDGSIPEGACILRVCDVFCALVQDRPYRKALTTEMAMSVMIGEVEKYNVKVFLAFQRVMHQSPDGSLRIPDARPEVEEIWRTL